ncbi:ZN345 protein, partial [Rhinopomastus cyanomelas]|nr:ZN345 protein [Rhinopomastus cyanomelas]
TFIQHLKGHKDPPPYLCPQCNEAFSSLSELLPHMYWHAGYRLFQCRCCTFSSFCLSSMVKHSYIPSRHESCVSEVCAGGFTSTLERHRRVHVGQETYKKFHGHLDTDAKRHRYICPECQYSTDSLGNLKMHLRTHTGERPYCCRKCKMKFRTSSHLKRHQLTHLTLAHLQCQHCDYSSSKCENLKLHMRFHSSEKPFQCDQCTAAFCTSSQLRRHQVTH